MPKIHVSIGHNAFLPVYSHTLESDFDVEFLYGSRDSGKSRHIAQKLIIKCMQRPKFKCAMIRKVANTIKDSQWQMIKSICEEWKIDHLFKFTTHPLEIRCINGGVFLARGMDEPKKIKSLTNPTDAWIEEGADIDQNDWTIITTSLRSNEYKAQIWFSFNPDIPDLYEDFWLYKRYFAFTPELSFTCTLTEELQDKSQVQIRYRATHSTFYDNPYCPAERKAIYEGLANVSEYDYRVYCLGLWATRKTGGEFLKGFKSNIHVKKGLHYDHRHRLYISLDNNVYPYVAVACWQLIQEQGIWYARQVMELPASDPDNTAIGAAKKIIAWLTEIGYYQTLYICGDRSTKNLNTIDEFKRSFFMIINEAIQAAGFRTEDKFLQYAPAPSSIADFVNAIFTDQVPGIQIEISDACKESVKDYIMTKADRTGNILKINKADYEGGPSYQHNGHFTDTLKDMMVQGFFPEYEQFVNRHKALKPEGVSVVTRNPEITGIDPNRVPRITF